MEWQQEDDVELLQKVIETLPRLKQYKLSEPQRVFVEKLEEMKQKVEEQMSQIQLAKN